MPDVQTPAARATSAASKDLSALRIDHGEEPLRGRRLPGWLAALVVLVGIAAALFPLLRGMSAFAPEIRVGEALVERPGSGADIVLAASGYVVARTKAAVSAKLAGRLEELNVEEGSIVSAGDIIARLENDALDAEMQAARATSLQSEASLARSRADLDLARIDLGRQEQLVAADLGTRSDLDSARSIVVAREAAVAEAAASLAASRARLVQAEVGLESANVRAPFDGVVLRKEAEVGEYVAPSVASGSLTRGAIVTMADLRSLEVEADVAEGNIGRLMPEMHAEIGLDAVPDRRYRGRLRQVMPTAERQKATVQVKVSLLDPDERVKPEMSAKVTFLSSEPDPAALSAPAVVTAPASAIVVDSAGGGASAWIAVDGVVHRVSVTTGERRGDRVVIASGLSGGESLVLAPAGDLSDGMKVKVASR